MKKREILKCEKGFTLIEVIAVLIILGILAAVAVPKYFDVSDEARRKAYDSALSQGMSLCSLAYGKAALSAGGDPTMDDVFKALAGDSEFTDDTIKTEGTTPVGEDTGGTEGGKEGIAIAGDFDFTFTKEDNRIKIEVSPRKWNLPENEDPDEKDFRIGYWVKP